MDYWIEAATCVHLACLFASIIHAKFSSDLNNLTYSWSRAFFKSMFIGSEFNTILFLFLFSDLENLVELDLSLNFLSSVPVGALGQLRNLKFLNLGSNRIQVSE